LRVRTPVRSRLAAPDEREPSAFSCDVKLEKIREMREVVVPPLLTVACFLLAAHNSGWAQTDPVIRMHDDEDAQELVIEVGPIDLPVMVIGQGGDHLGVSPIPAVFDVPRTISMYGFNYDIVDGAGRSLPVTLLHHFNIVDPDHREWYLPIARRVLAIGQDTDPPSLPKQLIGMRLDEGQRLAISATLMNMGTEKLEGVTIRVRLRYMEPDGVFPVFSIVPFHIDVAFPNNDRDFDLPPGESVYFWEGRPASDGRILGLGTHLHDYAESLVFENVTEGDTIWTATAVRREDGTIDKSPVAHLYRKFGIGINAEDLYRVTVRYRNDTGKLIRSGGMGLVAGVFLPSDDATFAADTSDILYNRDLNHFLQRDQRPRH